MNRRLHHANKLCLCVVALVLFGVLPGAALSQGIGFRNDLPHPVVVQGASKVGKVLRRGEPLVIHPRKVAWDINIPLGDRHITIHDAKQPSLILFQGPVRYEGVDRFFYIRPGRSPGPPVQLVPGPPPPP